MEATQTELNKFVQVVDEFKVKYARLTSPAMRANVYASGNQKLISDYENAVTRGARLNTAIAAAVGAWATFKRGYGAVTDVTSTAIGDAVDTIRGWFGYDPAPGLSSLGCGGGLGTLAAIQIVPAVIITGFIATAVVLIAAMNRIFISVEASRIQRENPSITRTSALRQAEAGLPSFIPGGITPVMIGVGALALWMVLGSKK